MPAPSAPKIYLIDRPGSVQTVLQLGNLGIERADPDYFALLLMDKVVGNDPAARLFKNLREAKGYTYGAYSSFSSSKFRGTFQASSEVRTAVTDGAIKEFMFELKRIREERVTTEELENAKRSLVGSFALSLERPATLLQNIITQKLYNLPADYWDTYPQKVAAITAADVQRAAQKYVDLAHLQIVAVGDASQIRDVLAKYGTVEVFDSEGKLVKGNGKEKFMTRPDFTGTWKFNSAKSVLQIPSPESSIFVIEHSEPKFSLERTHVFGGKSNTFSVALTTNGKLTAVNLGGFESQSKLYWEGDSLVFDSRFVHEGEQASNIVRYRLEGAGQTLIAEEQLRSAQHKHDNRWVFDKQNP